MVTLNQIFILRKFKKEYYIIEIENGDVYKIHEIGFRALEYLSEAHTLREIAQLISGPNDSPSKIEQLMQPFWAMLQSKGIVEET